MNRKSPLEEQAREALSILQAHLQAYRDGISRDEYRSIAMAVQRLERGLAGERDTDARRTLRDHLAAERFAGRVTT